MYSVKTIDRLLQNELAAAATYQQVFDKFQDDGGFNESAFLTPIYEAHKSAVSDLETQIRELGGTPSKHSGVWGAWAKIIHDGANRLSKQAALNILQQGEKNGTEDYLKVLRNAQLPLSIRCLIEWKLLLIQISHTRILDQLLDPAPA